MLPLGTIEVRVFFALPWRLEATLTSYLMCLLQLRLRSVSQANTNFGRVRANKCTLFAGLEMDLRHCPARTERLHSRWVQANAPQI